MRMSDKIEAFILELLNEEDDWIDLKRNELAVAFNCVPSQINYVLDTRFSLMNGYITESRRGGGGYLRIRRVKNDANLSAYILAISDSIDFNSASSLLQTLYLNNKITKSEFELILTVISDRSLTINQPYKNKIRADILKNALAKIDERNEINYV